MRKITIRALATAAAAALTTGAVQAAAPTFETVAKPVIAEGAKVAQSSNSSSNTSSNTSTNSSSNSSSNTSSNTSSNSSSNSSSNRSR